MAVLSKPCASSPTLTHWRIIPLEYKPKVELDDRTVSVAAQAYKLFGWRLRDWQAKALQSLVLKRDLFVKAGTGSGKSAVFLSMIAAKEEGIVLVIVPLKSLMEDQVPPT
jgi:superfamily II DNA helicase RecQ